MDYSRFLVADVFGRANSVLRKYSGDSAPDVWRQHIQKAQAWIDREKMGPFTRYSAVLEGGRQTRNVTLEALRANGGTIIADAIIALRDNPTTQKLLSLSPFIETFGIPEELIDAAFAVLKVIRLTPRIDINSEVLAAFSILTHVAVLTKNATLADNICDTCLEAARTTDNSGAIFEFVARLVECASVNRDRTEAMQTLTNRLETLAFTLPASRPMAGLVSALESLKRVQPQLRPLLGRALAAAKLGTSRSPIA